MQISLFYSSYGIVHLLIVTHIKLFFLLLMEPVTVLVLFFLYMIIMNRYLDAQQTPAGYCYAKDLW